MEQGKLLNKRIEAVSEEANVQSKVLFQVIAFYIGDQLYALDVMSIRDIIIPKKTYRVPNTNERLLGVLNVRGEILPLYSLKLILGMQDELKGRTLIEVGDDKFIITVKKDRDLFGILVDGIYQNITATLDNFRKEEYLSKWSKNYLFSGVILEEEKEILVLKTENLLNYIISLK